MRHEDKPPGMTLAEALGLDIDPKAPGGQRMSFPDNQPRAKRAQNQQTETEYQGFVDIDGYNNRSV